MSNEVISEINKRIQEIKKDKRRVMVLQNRCIRELEHHNKAITKLDGDIILAEAAITKLKNKK